MYISDTPKVNSSEIKELLNDIKLADDKRSTVSALLSSDRKGSRKTPLLQVEKKISSTRKLLEKITPRKPKFSRQYSKELDQTPAVRKPPFPTDDPTIDEPVKHTGLDSPAHLSQPLFTTEGNNDENDDGDGSTSPNFDNIDISTTLLFQFSPAAPLDPLPSHHPPPFSSSSQVIDRRHHAIFTTRASDIEQFDLIAEFDHLKR